MVASLAGKPFLKNSWHQKYANTEIGNGYRAAFVGWKGDLKARRENHYFTQHYNAMLVCDSCNANTPYKKSDPALTYADFSDGAGWRKTRYTHAVYLANAKRVSPWSQVDGWSIEGTWFDLMHNLPYGVGKDVAANILCELAESNASPAARLLELSASAKPTAIWLTKVCKLSLRKLNIVFFCTTAAHNWFSKLQWFLQVA